jgi:hypothetical protein
MNAALFTFIANSRMLFRKFFTASGYGDGATVDNMFDCVWFAYLDLQGMGMSTNYPPNRMATDCFTKVMDALCRLAAMTFGGQSTDYMTSEYKQMRDQLA